MLLEKEAATPLCVFITETGTENIVHSKYLFYKFTKVINMKLILRRRR